MNPFPNIWAGKWEYKVVDTPLKQVAARFGHPEYEGLWYYEEPFNEETTKQVTYYRYRDRL